MSYTGRTVKAERCAICKTVMPKNTLVYFDGTKKGGFNLAHASCWEPIRKQRMDEQINHPSFYAQKVKKNIKPIISNAELNPPF